MKEQKVHFNVQFGGQNSFALLKGVSSKPSRKYRVAPKFFLELKTSNFAYLYIF